ncbi:MAG: adenylate kinase [Bacteroidales bacterium]|nr:adenylate kinase [Bacteroidales bacterium]
MLNIVLFGPPGAGKGTQAARLIDKYELVHLSTGDILRAEIKAESQLGKEAKNFMEKGELVPDSVVIGMIETKIDSNLSAKGFIFDGFPRTTAQALALDTMLTKKHLSITLMLALEVDDDELIKRLLLRGKDSGRADDQDQKIIENRIHVYNKETAPVIDFYDNQNKFKAVTGVGSIDEIFGRLCNAIDAVK